jgi:hypothetical protein
LIIEGNFEASSMEASSMEASAEDRKTHYKAEEECQEDDCYIDYFNLFPFLVNMENKYGNNIWLLSTHSR